MFTCSTNGEPLFFRSAPFCRNGNELFSAQILTSNGFRNLFDTRHFTAVHNLTTVLASTRTNVNNPIGCANGVFIVLDNHDSVPKIAQTNKSFNQSMIVALMQSNAWFVKHVQRAHKSRANLTCKTDPLRFSASQCCCSTRKCEVIKSNRKQKSESCIDFFSDAFCDHFVAITKL